MPRNKELKVKNKNLNVKFPDDDYRELQQIADEIGGMTLSSMIRMLIYTQLNKVRETGEPRNFVIISNQNIEKVKERVLNVKLPENDYKEVQMIANGIGITVSLMVRMLIYSQLDKVRKLNDSKSFLNTK